MDLHPPDLFALLDARHLESHVRADASLECRIEVRGQVRGEDDHAIERFELVQQHVDRDVRLALIWKARDGGRSTTRDRIGLIEEEQGALLGRRTKRRDDVLGRFACPHGFDFCVVHDQQLHAEGVGDRFSADGFARAGRTDEVERQSESDRVPLAESPSREDQRMIADLRERVLERSSRFGGQDHISERSLRREGLNRARE